ncbi:MAG: hypothetical protein ACETWM_19670 [Candidatus Lokiarchaeia archaeon]
MYVKGDIVKFCDKEYGFFKRDVQNYQINGSNIDLLVNVDDSQILPIRPKGANAGIKLILDEEPKQLYYNSSVSPDFCLQWIEALFWWDDKCMIHAAAIAKGNQSYLLCAPANTGKTSCVLELIKEGWEYLGDDWIIVGNNKIYSFPKTIHIFDYNIVYDKEYFTKYYRIKKPMYLYSKLQFFIKKQIIKRVPSRFLRYGINKILSRPLYYLKVNEILPKISIADYKPIDKVFFLQRQNCDKICINPIDISEIINKICHILLVERAYFLNWYYLYAALEKEIFYIESWREHYSKVLSQTLKNTIPIKVLIPLKGNPKDIVKVIKSIN